MPVLTVSLLGEFNVDLDNQHISDINYVKVRALLAYLITKAGTPIRREHLIGLLWPESPDNRARQSLSQALSTLRTLIGDRRQNSVFIQANRHTIAFDAHAPFTLDVADFEQHLDAIETCQHIDITQCESCLVHMESAVEIYRGDFLQGLSIGDSIAFEEWAMVLRENLRRRAMGILDQLARVYLNRKQYTLASATAQRLINQDRWNESAYRLSMQALALDGKRNQALGQYDSCRALLETDFGAEPDAATVALYESILDGTLTVPLAKGDLPPAPGSPPFLGLRYFDVADAPLFFGRDDMVQRILSRIDAGEDFLAIIGASGSGKSSLVRAGAMAHLIDRGKHVVHIITPTANPVASLCQTLCHEESARDAMQERILDSPTALTDVLQQMYTSAPHILVVDQFEEVFTLCHDLTLRTAFIENLLIAAQSSILSVIITLRADYYHHCAEHELLRHALESQQLYIGAMSYEELRQAIEQPARLNAWDFEAELVDLMLEDIGATPDHMPEPGALPLLSHALLETWKRRQGRTLTLRGYAASGGVRGAIAHSAEAVYQAFPPEQQRIARMIFLRLTEFGDVDLDTESKRYTRRRVSLDEIQPTPELTTTIRGVLNILASARLITMQRDAVEVAHEALIREWPTLREWLSTDQERLRAHRHLTEAAHTWELSDNDPGDLYRGARLAQIEEWPDEAQQELNALEREFLTASREEEDRIATELEEQRQRELSAARQVADLQRHRAEERGRLVRWIGLTAAILFIAVIGAGALGWGYRNASNENADLAAQNADVANANAAIAATAQASEALAIISQEREAEQRAAAEQLEITAATQRDLAQEQARLNLAMSLASQVELNQEKEPDLSLLLALQANKINDSALTRGALMTALDHSPGKVRFFNNSNNYFRNLTLASGGTTLIASNKDLMTFWDTSTQQVIAEFPNDDNAWIHGHTLSHASNILAVLSLSTSDYWYVSFYDIAALPNTPTYLGQLILEDYDDEINTHITMSPDGQELVSAGCEDPYWVQEQDIFCDNELLLRWDVQPLITGSGQAELVDRANITGEAYDIAFSPDGKVAGVVGCTAYDGLNCTGGFTLLWDMASGEFRGEGDSAYDPSIFSNYNLAFSPDDQYIVVSGCATQDRTYVGALCEQAHVDIWDIATLSHITRLTPAGNSDSWSLAYAPDGQTLAIGNLDVIQLWQLGTPGYMLSNLVGHSASVEALVFAPDGQTLYSGGDDRMIGEWDLDERGGLSDVLDFIGPAAQMELAPDGTTFAVPALGGIQIRDTASGALIGFAQLPNPEQFLWDVAYTSDGSMMASSNYMDGTIQLWDVENRIPLGSPVRINDAQAYGVEFSPDDTLLAATSNNPVMYLIDVESMLAGEVISRTLIGHEHGGIPQLTFSSDGSMLASGGHDTSIRFWDTATATEIGEPMYGHEHQIVTNVFSPDGTLLVSAARDLTIRIWDVATRTELAVLKGHEDVIWRVAFTPDGNTLISVDATGYLRLWDMSDPERYGQPIGATLPAHHTDTYGLLITQDAQYAYTTARSGELVRWQLDPAVWRERACEILDRDLTAEEWAFYLPGEEPTATCP